MRRRSVGGPLWENQVNQTVHTIKKKSKSRSLKSSDVYECICIYINDHLKKRILSHSTITNYYRHLKLFLTWLNDAERLADIRKIDESHIRRYFTYLEITKNYKKDSLKAVQVVLIQFFRSMKLRRLIRENPVKDFKICVKSHTRSDKLLTPFDIMILLRSVKEHYQYLNDNKKPFRFSLFLHRRDICIFALCAGCGLRRGEIQRIKIDDVDFDKKTIRIPGKGSKRFTIKERTAFFSHSFLEQILTRYYRMRIELPGSSFFCNWLGDELSVKAIESLFKTYNSFISQNTYYNPTIIRKSFCTHLVHKKVNIQAIHTLMGHEKCETTLKYYVQLSASEVETIWKETNPYGNIN